MKIFFLEMKMNGDNQVNVRCLSYFEVSEYAAKFWILGSSGNFFSNRRFVNILLFRFVLILYATEISYIEISEVNIFEISQPTCPIL